MTLVRLTSLTTACGLLLLAGAAAQPLPPGNVPNGPPPGVYTPPPPGGQQGGQTNSVCLRLEGALAQLDSASNAAPDTSRRYEDAIARQRYELDQTIMQGRRMGCDSGGGFFIFGAPRRPPQCDQINNQITRMRSNIDRMTAELSHRRGGSDVNRDLQRRQLLISLQQNNCGPQYRNAAPQQQAHSKSFLEKLFGGWQEESNSNAAPLDVPNVPTSSTFRTLCVRTCDGYYFPFSYATVPARFSEDDRTCKRLCPAAETALYTYRNPGEEVEQAMSLSGQPYTALPTAFKYRQELNPSCSCRAAGQSWADALGVGKDQTVQQGDIIVTEERAKQLAQPKQGKDQARAPASKATAEQSNASDAPAQQQAEHHRKFRVVGPEFYPTQ
jgi:hypothetical protein